MEPIPPAMAKKLLNMVRLVFFMLRKGVSKTRLMLDLNLLMERTKVAGKSLCNLLSHGSRAHDPHASLIVPGEYEFSCSSSPVHHSYNPFHIGRRRGHTHSHASPTETEDPAVLASVLVGDALAGSPTVSLGFGRRPWVRPLRITDSPFPLRDVDADDHIDEAAEEFIQNFYKDLRLQKNTIGQETPYHNHCN